MLKKILFGFVPLMLLTLIIWQFNTPTTIVNNGRSRAPQQHDAHSNSKAAQIKGPFISEVSVPVRSDSIRDLSPINQIDPVINREINPRHNPNLLNAELELGSRTPDALAANGLNTNGRTPTPLISFEGMNGAESGRFAPPDTVGDVGPDHYVQMVNVAMSIYAKDGTRLTGPTSLNDIWEPLGAPCGTQNEGDPIVLYDSLDDRWLLSQFTSPNGICIAISQTADPTGDYWLYSFATPEFPDYFKFGVWPDAYFMSANESTYTAYAFDRLSMLDGEPAAYQFFSGGTNLYLPSDLDGANWPWDFATNTFYTFKDDEFADHGGGDDRLELWEFYVDWFEPSNSSFELVESIPITPFSYTVCGFFNLECIPQPIPGANLDALSEWPMYRFVYRNFDTYESLIGNFTVNVNASSQAGIRWFELRRDDFSTWELYQEGTYAPDDEHRWVGSIAMDQDGNIALGYTVSSESTFPSIRYATRLAADPLGTLQTETTLIAGGGVQTDAPRWGDYAAMSIDPTDDCTFWYTNEYYAETSGTNWQTRIGAFKIPSCGGGGSEPVPWNWLPIIKH